jgi:DNA-binding beta-propeller fold protein YncE
MGNAIANGWSRLPRVGLALAVALSVWLAPGCVSVALAAGEAHPLVGEFGSFSNPNGIAVDEATGDVYVADIATSTVYKLDANGNPVSFSKLGSNALSGGATPGGSFSFPNVYGTPAAVAVDNTTSPSDPSRGDLYVMDAGHGVIDKFGPDGEYLGQITGFTPATGSSEHELLGLAVDAGGTVRVDLSTKPESVNEYDVAVNEYDDSPSNHLVAVQLNEDAAENASKDSLPEALGAHGFAVGPTGDDFRLYEGCACVGKLGSQLADLGQVDRHGSGDVALSVDPATNHVYIDDQSSVGEWDTGAINGQNEIPATHKEFEGAGVLVGSFGSLQLSGSSGQGGLAVNGSDGKIYVSNPADGKVYVFGSDTPAVASDMASGITKESAILKGTVDPRGEAVTSCRFEYGVAEAEGNASYEHGVSCAPAGIGTGNSPVAVSAGVEGLSPGLLYRYRLVAANADGSSESSGLVATLGAGFGIKAFEVSFVNEDGSPDVQAGSHPYAMHVNITYSSHFMRSESNADSLYVQEPDGTLKDLAVDLPPGLVGDPNAVAKKCTIEELNEFHNNGIGCPKGAYMGQLQLVWGYNVAASGFEFNEPVYEMVPPHGVPLQLGINYINPDLFINNGLRAGSDYPIEATLSDIPPAAPVLVSRLTVYGVSTTCVNVGAGHGKYQDGNCQLADTGGEYEREPSEGKPFLTLPTGCHGPLRSSIRVDSYQEPGHWVGMSSITRSPSGTPVSLSGCSKLLFPPSITVAPDSTNASTSSGLTVGVHVSQTAAFNPQGLGESGLRDSVVTLPEGVTLNPSGADGLEACSEGLAGFTGLSELNPEEEPGVQTTTFTPDLPEPLLPGVNFCSDGTKIGTVKIRTPLLEHELEGAVYLASQNTNPFGSLVAMYMIIEDPVSSSLVKLAGEVKLSATGRIVTTFDNSPSAPFEELSLHFFGGERAPLSTPSRCGTYTTEAVFTPWDGNGPVTATSSFVIDHGPNGGPCPGSSLPFDPSLTAGTISNQASGLSPFTMTMSREDGEQNLQAISLKMPPGLSGTLTGVELCPEAEANAGTCGPNSQIGETIVSVGVGNDPFTVKGGRVYLTGPYKGAPFGLSIVNPAKAGPYDVERDTSKPSEYMPGCDCLVVRAKVEVDPVTADITVTSDNEGPYKIPTILDGIPLQIKHVNVLINRPGFTFNPTDCEPMSIDALLHGAEGSTSGLSVPFQVTNCARLSFKPSFKVSTSAKTSRNSGASLHVKLSYPKLPFSTQANIKSVKVDLPRQLPSRLETLKKACLDTVFNQNPAACPAASRVGHAKATTPIVPVPLEGPAYFVSHGGAKFPELIIVLQGYGVTVYLHGETFISKGITSSTFHTIPDVPVGTFELNLPQGSYSALAGNGNLCASALHMPTAFTAQNGVVIHQSTPIAVSGCVKHKTHKHKKKHKNRHKKKK